MERRSTLSFRQTFGCLWSILGRRAAAMGGLLLIAAIASCVSALRYESVPTSEPTVVHSPVKAHLVDGSTIVFPGGADILRTEVRGTGRRYDVALAPSGTTLSLLSVPLDSVVAMESFANVVNYDRSIAYGLGGFLIWYFVLGSVSIAIFGSCPTVYSDNGGDEVLEAEAFSYSIVPMFESRDIDRLTARVNEEGEIRLEVRNEALETHYINHLELIEVDHASGELAVPDQEGHPLVLAQPIPVLRAVDRDGRDVTEALSNQDGIVFHSSRTRIEEAIASGGRDVEDHVELVVPVPTGAEQIGLHLRMRNSLLATVLFYEMMLGDRGSRALDWLGQDLGDIGPAVELGQWARDNLGMRVSVLDGGEWRDVAHITDKGPLAWDDVAVVVPVTAGTAEALVRIRLSFPADHWRIDQAATFLAARSAEGRAIGLSTALNPDGVEQSGILSDLASPDEAYLVTSPGQSFEAVFRPGLDRRDMEVDSERTFFLASEGYYIEWVRREWLVNGRETEPFRPGPETLAEALRRWRESRETMEDQFYASRIPVR